VFPPGLSPNERKFIHNICQELGLKSKSRGKGDDRYLTVSRADDVRMEELHIVDASYRSQQDLAALFAHTPPTPDELRGVIHPPSASTRGPVHQSRGGGGDRSRDARHAAVFEQAAAAAAVDAAKLVVAGGGGGGGGSSSLLSSLASLDLPPASPAAVSRYQEMLARRAQDPRYRQREAGRRKLPVAQHEAKIVRTVVSHQVTVVSGETGCGKSTQVPQFLLDSPELGPGANIVCTQPRRVSAISLAERIAWERCEEVGATVGYQIKLEKNMKPGVTQLLLCTTGILIRRLLSDPLLNDVTHLVVDEVHERDRNTDFLLVILRDILPLRPHLRVVLMSATIEVQKFSDYFGGAPVIEMEGFTYPIRQ
jgi:ATP-dependent RNA helicase DHX36